MSSHLWHDLHDAADDEDTTKGKICVLLKPHHIMCKSTELEFCFDIQNEQSNAMQKVHVCLPTTCNLLGIPHHIAQAVKVELLSKEEYATKLLAEAATTPLPLGISTITLVRKL